MRARIHGIGVRVLEYGVTLFVALTVNFGLPYIAPGEPLRYVVGQEIQSLSASERQELRATYGLDEPLFTQYVDYLTGIPQGDLGTSVMYGQAVSEVLLQYLPWTLLLVGCALALSTILGVIAGAWSAWNEGSRADSVLTMGVLIAESTPAFWVGMILITVFAATLGWFPTFGIRSVGGSSTLLDSVFNHVHHLILPVVTLTLARVGGIYLVARGSVLTTIRAEYLTLARAKGLSEQQVLFRHALPNSLLPVYTRFTMQLGSLVGGAVVVETVFSYPGLGLLIYDAAIARDYPLLQGAFLVLTVTVIAANLLADLTYPLLDPRTQRSQEARV